MANARVEAFAPATIANLGVGFDILGLALHEPGDHICAERRDEPGVVILGIQGDDGKLTLDPEKNTAGIAASSVLRTLGATDGVALTLDKRLPLSSGLGSSAASAVAAAVAVNALYGSPLSDAELLPACLDGEAAVSGYHADNVGPCLFGGITLVWGTSADRIHHLPVPPNIHLVLATPDVAVPTKEARAVLPKQVDLKDMVRQTAGVARLVDALHRGDIAAMADAMECDCIVEPARAHLMPKLDDARSVAKKAGALGLVISGAGPTLCAICDHPTTAQTVAMSLKSMYDEANIPSTARITYISQEGARVLSIG
jgi:homoserine kinase